MKRFEQVPRFQLSETEEAVYWNTLLKSGQAKARFCEALVNTYADIRAILDAYSMHTFYVWDPEHSRLCAEGTLCNFVGLAAQVHFSIHPNYRGSAGRQAAIETLDWMMTLRRQEEDQPLVKSIFGLTPVGNKLALKFIQCVGFELRGILPGAVYDAPAGQYVDAVISVRSAHEQG